MTKVFSIFILKPKADSLKSAENFLRNRGWNVGTGVKLQEALAFIIQKKPDLIMIPSDHPNKKVRILPKILSQAFPIKIIVYCDSSAGNAIAAMHEMGCEYTLFPPVSGPSIERITLKIEKDEERRKKEAEERKALGLTGDETPDTIRLKGENLSDEQRNSSFASAQAALSQLMSSDGDDPGTFVAKGDGPLGDFGGIGQSGDSSAQKPSESYADWEARRRAEQEAGGSSSSSSNTGSGAIGGMGGGSTGGGGGGIGGMGSSGSAANGSNGFGNSTNGSMSGFASGQSDPSGSFGGANSNTSGANTSGNAPGFGGNDPSNWGTSQDPTSEGSASDPNSPSGSRKNKNAPVFEQAAGEKKKKQVPRYKRDPNSNPSELESIIVKGTQQALDETVTQIEGSEETPYQEIESASHCACIVVESERFSGYLVAAMGKNRKIDQNFMTMIKQRLFAFLRAHGEVLKTEESMSIKIQEVEFEDWALEQADFLRKSIHEGDEVAMAFFPTKDTNIALEESVAENMLKMDISELKEDTAVEFDLYIYMPDNKKYLLYTQQGRPLYGDQKKRLSDRGVTHMHLRKESAGEVKKYRAQNYLNEKIDAFRAAQKIKAK